MSMSDGISPMTPEEHDAMKRMMERIANVGAGTKPTYHATESVEEAKAVVGQCMSATERLREMLDERGVEHADGTEITLWLKDDRGCRAIADERLNGFIHLRLWCTTPEQAIEATLGRGECKDVCAGISEFICSACGFNCDLTSWISLFDGDEGRHRHHHHGTPNYCPNCGRKVVER